MDSIRFKQIVISILGFLLLAAFIVVAYVESMRRLPDAKPRIVLSDDNAKCVNCHQNYSNARAVTEQWKASIHARKGVGCLECHQAGPSDADAFVHYTYTIATVVTPKDCSQCHAEQFRQFQRSDHARGGKAVLDSLANVPPGTLAAGSTVPHVQRLSDDLTTNACIQCHGSAIRPLLDESGRKVFFSSGVLAFDVNAWPNTGIGRLNPDGSLGSCASCHNRHLFSVAQARQPEACDKCHRGPDHPHYEFFRESQHRANFLAYREKMNLERRPWIVGVDYYEAPSCATCHMGATPNQTSTHDVGARLTWKHGDRPTPVSQTAASAKEENSPEEAQTTPLDKRRSNMEDVCHQCHAQQYVKGFFQNYDRLMKQSKVTVRFRR